MAAQLWLFPLDGLVCCFIQQFLTRKCAKFTNRLRRLMVDVAGGYVTLTSIMKMVGVS